jgi:hypothetical protein
MKTSHLPRSKNITSVVLMKQHFSVPKEADVREATVRELKKLFPDTTEIKGKIVGFTGGDVSGFPLRSSRWRSWQVLIRAICTVE